MSLTHVERIVRPASVREAWEARMRAPEATRFLAGGVDLVLYAPPSVTTLVDLAGLGLGAIRPDGQDLVIGATATLSEALASDLVRAAAGGFLGDVLRRVASPLQRNVATVGGAAVRAHPWSDVVPALLVLDAELEAFDGNEVRVPLAGAGALGRDVFPLVTAIRIPAAWLGARAAFEKFARSGFDVATLNCACAVRLEKGICREARVAVGGTPGLARRLPDAEAALCGGKLTADRIAAAADAAARTIDARDDRRASAAYRRRLAAVGVRRCLTALGTEERSRR